MGRALWIALAVLPVVYGHPTLLTVQTELQTEERDRDPPHLQSESPNSVIYKEDDGKEFFLEISQDDTENKLPTPASDVESNQVNTAMPVVELNPSYYQARRAAKAAEHYLNYHYGSPFKLFSIRDIKSATLEELPEGRGKYNMTFAVDDAISNKTAGICTAEIVFNRTEEEKTPEVHCTCDDLLKVNTSEAENSFFHQVMQSTKLVEGEYIPDSFGFIAPEMKPWWQLGILASSFVMLKESNESTLYNMAQILSVKQQKSEENSLLVDYDVLLHDFISQEMIQWHIQASWSPTTGVKVTKCTLQPKKHSTTPATVDSR
ncbi:latexin isoform X2 [Amia ocellicauda]|uniref:latexin isoform X2 n=1 Tax=Amia ocellicauda TaxID=2972642 RepID=UPI00346440FF|nr:LXN protein [Amia calva]